MDRAENTQAQEAELQRIKELIVKAMAGELEQIAKLLASKDNTELFGKTEFELRRLVLAAGSRALEAVLEDRKKGGTKAAVPSARSVSRMPVLSAGAGGR